MSSIGFNGAGPKSITVTDGTTTTGIITSGSDGTSNTTNRLETSAQMKAYNGATWDRVRAGLTVVTASLSGVLNTLPWALYNAVPTTRAESQGGPIQATSQGDLKVGESYAPAAEDNTNGIIATAEKPLVSSTYSWSRFQNLGANATLNVKATPGNLLSFYCHNLAGVVRYFQIHNTATVPAAAAVPVYSFLLPISSTLVLDSAFFGSTGMNFAAGIAFAFSTTEATMNTGSAADHITFIQYK